MACEYTDSYILINEYNQVEVLSEKFPLFLLSKQVKYIILKFNIGLIEMHKLKYAKWTHLQVKLQFMTSRKLRELIFSNWVNLKF